MEASVPDRETFDDVGCDMQVAFAPAPSILSHAGLQTVTVREHARDFRETRGPNFRPQMTNINKLNEIPYKVRPHDTGGFSVPSTAKTRNILSETPCPVIACRAPASL